METFLRIYILPCKTTNVIVYSFPLSYIEKLDQQLRLFATSLTGLTFHLYALRIRSCR